MKTSNPAARIRELNDAFRKTFAGGKMVMTASVAALPEMVKASALTKLPEFNDFAPENDPHGEHDFLSFEHCDHFSVQRRRNRYLNTYSAVALQASVSRI